MRSEAAVSVKQQQAAVSENQEDEGMMTPDVRVMCVCACHQQAEPICTC